MEGGLMECCEQCADTDGLAAALAAFETALQDTEQRLADGRAARASMFAHHGIESQRLAILERENAELRLKLEGWLGSPRQPLSATWHHLPCVTALQPKPLPARALNARYRGGLITEVAP